MSTRTPSLPMTHRYPKVHHRRSNDIGMKTNTTTRPWVPSSKCCWHGCPMTLCTPIGAGQMLCWMHALLMLWIPVDSTPEAVVTSTSPGARRPDL